MENPNSFFQYLSYFIIGSLAAISMGPVNSLADDYVSNVKITVSVYGEPDCTVNGGKTIDVDFGDVYDILIDGTGYKRLPIEYDLQCKELAKNSLNMILKWNETIIDGKSVISTNYKSFGIAVYHDSTQLNNNSSINFAYNNSPKLYVVPVKSSKSEFNENGKFTGNMTMIINYQ